MSMTIRLNGASREVGATTIGTLVAELTATGRLDRGGRGIAVARNGAVVPRSRWADTRIAPDDAIELVRATQGG
jgi:sulfur carrier protein